MKYLFKKILISLIPGLMFTYATIVTSSSTAHNDKYAIIGLLLYILAYGSLDLYTYLINKLNDEE